VASSSKLIAQPSFIVKPGANYPLESQAAREEGMVVLRITVNASGRPIEVRVVGSSGFYRLDRAALEGGWRCRIRNAHAGDQFDAPFRFKIQK
jgi:protein TonB